MKKKYPRSWELYERESGSPSMADIQLFLDSWEIFININKDKRGITWDIWTTIGNRFGCNIFPDREIRESKIQYYPDRPAALRDAVEKGLELLEGSLRHRKQ